MKNVKYEGVYPCMHNCLTIIFSYFKEKKLWTCSFNSQMDEEMESRSER
jgi:hypothetical protein